MSTLPPLPPCAACGGAFSTRAPYPGPRVERFALRFEEIATCGQCGLGMALPQHSQDALDRFYAAGAYWNEAVGRSQPQRVHERNQCRHRVGYALRELPARSGLRVLDIGAGHGWTAYWLERHAPGRVAQFDFVEPDDACSREILDRGARFAVSRVASLGAAQAGYDLIFLNHVLEHVADPAACVEQVAALLASDGIAYFETPFADQRFKPDVFPHTWFFTPGALKALAERAGVREVLREVFGRLPTSGAVDLVKRVAFRGSAELGLGDLAGVFDDALWRYAPSTEGIWLRWMISPRPPRA